MSGNDRAAPATRHSDLERTVAIVQRLLMAVTVVGAFAVGALVPIFFFQGSREALLWKPDDGRDLEQFTIDHGAPSEDVEYIKGMLNEAKILLGYDSSMNIPSEDDPDVLYSKEDLEYLLNAFKEELEMRKKRTPRMKETRFWNQSLQQPIEYKFSGQHSLSERIQIRKAFLAIEKVSCIRFRELAMTEKSRRFQFILIVKGKGCYSYIGIQRFPAQLLSLSKKCLRSGGTSLHEIMHSLGFDHEQKRSDRDESIEIHSHNMYYKNIQFKKIPSFNHIPYDITSIMQYPNKAFTKNGDFTISSKFSGHTNSLGQRERLTHRNVRMLNYFYCKGSCRGYDLETECFNSGIQDPNNCTRCICKPEFTGRYCEILSSGITPKKKRCGGEIILNNSNKSKILESPTYGEKLTSNKRMQCTWLIKAPDNCRVKMTLIDNFSLHNHKSRTGNRCVHYLDIYTNDKLDKNDFPDERLCGKEHFQRSNYIRSQDAITRNDKSNMSSSSNRKQNSINNVRISKHGHMLIHLSADVFSHLVQNIDFRAELSFVTDAKKNIVISEAGGFNCDFDDGNSCGMFTSGNPNFRIAENRRKPAERESSNEPTGSHVVVVNDQHLNRSAGSGSDVLTSPYLKPGIYCTSFRFSRGTSGFTVSVVNKAPANSEYRSRAKRSNRHSRSRAEPRITMSTTPRIITAISAGDSSPPNIISPRGLGVGRCRGRRSATGRFILYIDKGIPSSLDVPSRRFWNTWNGWFRTNYVAKFEIQVIRKSRELVPIFFDDVNINICK